MCNTVCEGIYQFLFPIVIVGTIGMIVGLIVEAIGPAAVGRFIGGVALLVALTVTALYLANHRDVLYAVLFTAIGIAVIGAIVAGLSWASIKLRARFGQTRGEWATLGMFVSLPPALIGLAYGAALIADHWPL